MNITLKTLASATEQEVFDHVASHLLAQGKKSLYKGSCSYRGKDGLKCAAGCLMADSEYDPDWEGKSWFHLIEVGIAPEQNRYIISELQKVHDNASPERWREKLGLVAEQFDLGKAKL